jgi:hypothetical protein
LGKCFELFFFQKYTEPRFFHHQKTEARTKKKFLEPHTILHITNPGVEKISKLAGNSFE